MTVIIRPSWPYLSPLLHVPGIHSWHADQELLCIWQAEDNSQRWVTLQGLYDRIDEWATQATEGFATVENARNPEIYWQGETSNVVVGLVDLDTLISNEQDGQHEEFHFIDKTSASQQHTPGVFDLRPGGFTASTGVPSFVPERLPDGRLGHHLVRGRWFYRSTVEHPPRNLSEFRAFLTENQLKRLDKDLRDRQVVMFGLIWRNQAGLVGTVLLASPKTAETGELGYSLVVLRPMGPAAVLLRAGPDSPALQGKTVAVVGVGAIGSHVVDQLTRSGVGRLILVDHDQLWPANMIRHSASPHTPPGVLKTTAMRMHLAAFPWTQIQEPDSADDGLVWTQDSIRQILESADLTIDATGHRGLSELISRVAGDLRKPYMSVALFQGGGVARVSRQAHPDDTPLVHRPHFDRYPTIPPLSEEVEYIGTEVGCLAQVHNAPPTSVVHAATLAVQVAVDYLTSRNDQPDEVIEVIRPSKPPFDRLGRLRPEDLPVGIDLSESASHSLIEAAGGALPAETGGVLIGCLTDGRPSIEEVIEIVDSEATPLSYRVQGDEISEAISSARERDPRLGYLGEWHSHQSDVGPSPLDIASMLIAAQDSGIDNPALILVYPNSSEGRPLAGFITTSAGLKQAEIHMTGGLPQPETEVQS